MTRKEAWRRTKGYLYDVLSGKEADEIIKALEQEPCGDAISREDAVHALRKALWDYEDKTEKQFRERDDLDYEEWYFHRIFVQAMNDEDVEAICKLPPVTPQPKTGHCKDCKWWKDSDGVYRRGVGAESKCPINNVSVNHGLGYCYMYEPQESEEKE